jgi:hypothetical protein
MKEIGSVSFLLSGTSTAVHGVRSVATEQADNVFELCMDVAWMLHGRCMDVACRIAGRVILLAQVDTLGQGLS